MAKRAARRKSPGMMEVVVCESDEQVAVALKSIDDEIRFKQSLDWVRQLRDALEPEFGKASKPSTIPAIHVKQSLYQLADAVLADDFSDRPFPDIVRTCFCMGNSFAEMRMMDIFDPLVSIGRSVSKSARDKAKLRGEKNLSTAEWKKVAAYIRKRNNIGIDISPACNEASRQLKTGAFQGISRRIELSGDALRKRWNKQ